MTVKRERLREAARRGMSTATNLADYLVRKGVAFRDAHAIVGQAVRQALDAGRDLCDLTLAELRCHSPAIDEDVYAVLTLEGSVAARDHFGGTAPARSEPPSSAAASVSPRCPNLSESHAVTEERASFASCRSALPGDDGAHSAYGNGSMTTLPPSTTCMCRA